MSPLGYGILLAVLGLGAADFACNGEEDYEYPVAGDCRLYYACSEGSTTPRQEGCSWFFHDFDPIKLRTHIRMKGMEISAIKTHKVHPCNQCDWCWKVDCSASPSPAPTAPPPTPPVPSSTTAQPITAPASTSTSPPATKPKRTRTPTEGLLIMKLLKSH